ncbi:MAG: hypothetical protein P1U87_15545 [Verrucomicrobiales bacterium]|nr:hypothetical protein [Verrucomicrobiales bacterium]
MKCLLTLRCEVIRRPFLRGALCVLVVHFLLASAFAHQVSSVSLISHLDTEKRVYLLDAAMEVVPSVDQILNDQISPEDAARQFAEEFLEIRFDDEEVTPELEISIETASDENTPAELQRQQVLVKMSGEFPPGAREFLLYLDPSCPMAVVMVAIKDDRPSRRMQVILAGEYSRPVNIEPLVEGDPFTASKEQPAKAEEMASEPAAVTETGEGSTSAPPAHPIISGWLGFFAGSFLPILFPVAILLLTLERTAAFGQIAALLIGQCLALALVSWGIIGVALWTSALAGLMLAAVSIEAIFRRTCGWWRYAIAFLSGSLSGILISNSSPFLDLFSRGGKTSMSDLIGFVLGTEMGLIASALVGAGLLLFLSRFDWYRQAIVHLLAVLFAAYGSYLAVERFF